MSVELLAIIWVLLDILVFFLYFMFLDMKWQTIGKIFMKIRVVAITDYQPITYQQSFIRSVLLLLDPIPYPLPGGLTLFSEKQIPSKNKELGIWQLEL